MNMEIKHSKKWRSLLVQLAGNTFDGIIFQRKIQKCLKMLWKLTWGFAKILFQTKMKTKVLWMKKNVLFGYFPNESVQGFFNALQICVFQCKSSKRQNGSKRMGLLLYWPATFWYDQKIKTEIIHSIKI